MPISPSSEPWKKYGAYPGQPAITPASRLRADTWQSLREIVHDAEQAGPQPRNVRCCGSHWAFSDAAVSMNLIVETNDPDERDNASAPRLNRPLYELIPGRLSDPAARFFEYQGGVTEKLNVLPGPAVSVVHVEAGMKIAELYSFLDLADGDHHIGRRFPKYKGAWAMPTLGGAGGQTVAGATQTGTHGGDVNLPPIADAIVAMHLIGANDRQFWIEGTGEPWIRLVDDDALHDTYRDRFGAIEIFRDNDMLRAAIVACGRFGIVYSVVLKVVRQWAFFEDRTENTWSGVRPWLDSYAVVSGSWFTQIVVNPLGQMKNPNEHSAYVTRRWRLPVDAAGLPPTGPAGRAERTGANAAREVTFDPTDPNARDSFINRLCEGAHPIRLIVDTLIQPFEAARDKALIAASVAEAVIVAALAAGFPAPPWAVAARTVALAAAAAAQATIGVLELVKTLAPKTARMNEALGDIANFLAGIDQLWILRGIFDLMMGSDQKPRSATAISYALMDIHNYRDWVCSKNGDSIEVFFDAWTTDAKNFIDLVFKHISDMEQGKLPETAGERMTFPGYVAIRFTRQTSALLGMQRWGHAVSLEIASINANKGTRPLLSRIHRDALSLLGPGGPRASIHWGQKNTVDMKHVEQAFDAWVPGGRLDVWRSVLSKLTRNGRDATFSTPFTLYAGLEVVQPLAYALTVSPDVVCAGAKASVAWDGMNNPPGTTARLMLRQKTPGAPVRTLGIVPLEGALDLDAPAGRHEVIFEVEYELNGRRLTDQRTADLRGIADGDVLTFQFVASCWQFGSVDRWWFDINPGHAGFGSDIVVATLRVSPSSGGAWGATRPGKADLPLPPGVTTPVPDRPRFRDSSWRFLSDDTGCTGPAPTVTVEFGLACSQ